ncbi:MAG TPA: hypothetical protein VGM34_04100 [Chlamydiales bacterium]|jgi:hypothetical protein
MGVVEQLEFDFSPATNGRLDCYREGAQSLVRMLLPSTLHDLPVVRTSELNQAPTDFSIFLLCKHRLNACHFFYELVSRWLLPQKKINVELFFSSDVRLPELSDELLSVAEVTLSLKNQHEIEEVRRNLQAIESEIKLGVVSDYQARRILEFKGLSSEGKTAMIQEKIGSLIQNHSKDFDPEIFLQMQQFLVNCPEEFKAVRDYHHISRIISNLHSNRKLLKKQVAALPSQRHIALKFLKTRLSLAKGKSKTVLGILASLNFLQEHEVFEKDHLMAAIHKQMPSCCLVEGSFFVDPGRETSLQMLYLEIEKNDGSDFSLEEIQHLRATLPSPMESHIEQLTHPIFMPRNEEEVLRNILSLSRQLRFVHDAPQATISFDETKSNDLCFTVIVVRFHRANAPTLGELISSKTSLVYLPDRVRSLGAPRRKYIKEATVFRTTLSAHLFLRPDRSIDLYKARGYILRELLKALGQIRDYNGGIILKQHEQLERLKNALGKIGQLHPILLEKFFHAINPMEMRTSADIDSLKNLFLLLLSATKTQSRFPMQGNDFLFKQEEDRLLSVLPRVTGKQKLALFSRLEKLQIPSHQYATVSIEFQQLSYTGFLLLHASKELQERFLNTLALGENSTNG